MTDREKLLNDLNTVDLKLMNHHSSDVRYEWAGMCDAALGDRSVWADMTDDAEIRKMLDNGLAFWEQHK